MRTVAFKMQLKKGFEIEYKKRHDEIWPELSTLLKNHGISNYSIFLDPSTLGLFGVLDVENPEDLDLLPHHEIMKKWWAYMADIMDTNADNSPASIALTPVFYMK